MVKELLIQMVMKGKVVTNQNPTIGGKWVNRQVDFLEGGLCDRGEVAARGERAAVEREKKNTVRVCMGEF